MDWEAAAAWAAVAQVHAALANAAANALGDHSPRDTREWRDAAATAASGMPEP